MPFTATPARNVSEEESLIVDFPPFRVAHPQVVVLCISAARRQSA
jgi:hypothetical protein